MQVIETYTYYGDINSPEVFLSSVQYLYNTVEDGKAVRIADNYDVIGSQEPGQGQYINTTRDKSYLDYKDANGDGTYEVVKVTISLDRISLNGQEAFIPATKTETWKFIDDQNRVIERSINWEYVCPSSGNQDDSQNSRPGDIFSGTNNGAVWVKASVDDRRKEVRSTSSDGIPRLAVITTSSEYVPGYNKPILMSEQVVYRYAMDVDGKKRAALEIFEYEYFSDGSVTNFEILTTRKIAYTEWDKDKNVSKEIEITDEFVDFSYIGQDHYEGYLPQSRKETRGLYENGYKTGIEVWDMNLAAPQYYTVQKIRDYRNSSGVKIGYTTEFYNEWGTLDYTSTTIFKRDAQGYLIGNCILTLSNIAPEYVYENSTYIRDNYHRISGMKKVTVYGLTTTGSTVSTLTSTLAPAIDVSVEEIHYKRDSVTHRNIGDITEKWSYNNGILLPDGHTITVNVLTDISSDGTTVKKTYRNVEYTVQGTSTATTDSTLDELYNKALASLDGGFSVGSEYLCTSYSTTTLGYDKSNMRLYTEETFGYTNGGGKFWIKKTYTYDLSDVQKNSGHTLDDFKGHATGWSQDAKGDDLCNSWDLNEDGYTGLRVDIYYDPISGRIGEKHGYGGTAWTNWQDEWRTYQTDYDDGTISTGKDLEDYIKGLQFGDGLRLVLGADGLPDTRETQGTVSGRSGGGRGGAEGPDDNGGSTIGVTFHQVHVQTRQLETNIKFDELNIKYDLLGRVTSETSWNWDKKNQIYTYSIKTNMQYYADNKLKSYDETTPNIDNSYLTYSHVSDIKYDSYGQEISRYISGSTKNSDGQNITFKGNTYAINEYDPLGLMIKKTVDQQIKYSVHKSGAWLGYVLYVLAAVAYAFGYVVLAIIFWALAATVGIIALTGGYNMTVSRSHKITDFSYFYGQYGRTEVEKVLKDSQSAVWSFYKIAETVIVVAIAVILAVVTHGLAAPLAQALAVGVTATAISTFIAYGLIALAITQLTAFIRWAMDDFKGNFHKKYFTPTDALISFFTAGILEKISNAVLEAVKDAGREVAKQAAIMIRELFKAVPFTVISLAAALFYSLIKWAITGKFEFDNVARLIVTIGAAIDLLRYVISVLEGPEGGIITNFMTKAVKDIKYFFIELYNTIYNHIRLMVELMFGNGKAPLSLASPDFPAYLVHEVFRRVLGQIIASKIMEAYMAKQNDPGADKKAEDRSIALWSAFLIFINLDVVSTETKDRIDMFAGFGRSVIFLFFANLASMYQTTETDKTGYKKNTGQEQTWVGVLRQLTLDVFNNFVQIVRSDSSELRQKALDAGLEDIAGITKTNDGWEVRDSRGRIIKMNRELIIFESTIKAANGDPMVQNYGIEEVNSKAPELADAIKSIKEGSFSIVRNSDGKVIICRVFDKDKNFMFYMESGTIADFIKFVITSEDISNIKAYRKAMKNGETKLADAIAENYGSKKDLKKSVFEFLANEKEKNLEKLSLAVIAPDALSGKMRKDFTKDELSLLVGAVIYVQVIWKDVAGEAKLVPVYNIFRKGALLMSIDEIGTTFFQGSIPTMRLKGKNEILQSSDEKLEIKTINKDGNEYFVLEEKYSGYNVVRRIKFGINNGAVSYAGVDFIDIRAGPADYSVIDE